MVTVPNVIGLPLRDAQITGLVAGLLVTTDPDDPQLDAFRRGVEGTVTDQRPRPGLEVERSSLLILEYVERGGGGTAGAPVPRRPPPSHRSGRAGETPPPDPRIAGPG